MSALAPKQEDCHVEIGVDQVPLLSPYHGGVDQIPISGNLCLAKKGCTDKELLLLFLLSD
eukprot:235723-Ditylum_brightwellii.AAC.1